MLYSNFQPVIAVLSADAFLAHFGSNPASLPLFPFTAGTPQKQFEVFLSTFEAGDLALFDMEGKTGDIKQHFSSQVRVYHICRV
jgi:hypothetical protein